jgi:YVTN family beta-propeller protein
MPASLFAIQDPICCKIIGLGIVFLFHFIYNKKPSRIAITSDEKEVYVTVPVRNTVAVIDTKTNMVRNVISVGEYPRRIAIVRNSSS